VEAPEQDGRHEHDPDKCNLDNAVQPERRAHAVRDPPADDTADREPAEVAGEDG
jgi:hypothetical protein